ncbi:L,D-transpeptidase [Rhodoblastus sp.]|uniref:L,D-transpeptidase n=1 Tax=Rhodoblastus sp. TaxID=1962975 RepID=UPI003F972061
MAHPFPSFDRTLKPNATPRKGLRTALALFAGLAIAPAAQGKQVVHYETSAEAGTVVIDAARRRLFFVLGDGRAIAYPVGVPRHGAEWSGETSVSGKYVRPDWEPPSSVKVEEPALPDLVRGGAPNNPMGARAITLYRSEIAIHGSTQRMRASIGGAVSHGCIRMYNEDVIDLFNRVHVGTPVLMLP